MAIVLDDKDPVFGGAGQKQGLPQSPASAPAQQSGSTSDLYNGMGDYGPPVTPPSSPAYIPPEPTYEEFWDNAYGGYRRVYSDGRPDEIIKGSNSAGWQVYTEDQLLGQASGIGDYGEYVDPGGLATPPPTPVSVGSRAPDFLDFAPEQFGPVGPAPVEIQNQQVGYINPWDKVPGAESYYEPGSGLDHADMTPSSRATPNITSGGNIWDSTLQTWVDPSGRIWWPSLNDWVTRAEYLRLVRGLSRYEDPIAAAATQLSDMLPFDVGVPETGPFSRFQGGGPELSRDFARADADLVSTIAGQPFAYESTSGMPLDYVDDGFSGVARRDFSYPNPYAGIPSAIIRGPGADLPSGVFRHRTEDGRELLYYSMPDGSAKLIEPLQDIPGVVEYVRTPDGRVQYEKDAVGRDVPMTKATMTGTQMLAEAVDAFVTAATLSPYQLDEFDSIRAKLPNFVNESIELAVSPVGLATMMIPFASVGGKGAVAALNVAQDLMFGITYSLSKEAGAPTPVALALAFAASAGSEMAVGKAFGREAITASKWSIENGKLVDPVISAATKQTAKEAAENIALTGRGVSLTDVSGTPVRGVDLGPGVVPTVRKVQLPDGSIIEQPKSLLTYDEVVTPVARVVDDVVVDSPAAVGFVTSRGSTYTINPDGTTTRMQAKDATHPGGPQPPSTSTFYLDPDDATKLMDIWNREGTVLYAVNKDKNLLAAVHLSGPNKGKIVENSEVPYKARPEVGLAPFETWNNTKNNTYGVHFGTNIVSVQGGAKVVTGNAAVREIPSIAEDGAIAVKQELYNPSTGKVVSVSSDDLAAALDDESSVSTLTRPTSLKKGDVVLLGDSTGADYLDQTRYTVDNDIPDLGPLNSVRLRHPDDNSVRTVLANRLWKSDDAAVSADDIMLLHAGVSPAEVIESLSRVSRGIDFLASHTVDRLFVYKVKGTAAPYTGVIHTLPTKVHFGDNVEFKDISKAHDAARRAEPALIEVLHTAVRNSYERLGKIDKDGFMEDLRPSAWERANLPQISHPHVADVLQHPDRYELTPEMREAITDLRSVRDLIRKDNEFWGVPADRLVDVDDSGVYFARYVSEVKDQKTGVIKRLVRGKGEVPLQKRITVSQQQSRKWTTAAEAYVKGGVRYMPLLQAFDLDVSTRLANSRKSWFLNTLAEQLGRTVMDDETVKRTAAGKKEATEKLARYLLKGERLAARMGNLEAAESAMSRMVQQFGRAMPTGPSRNIKKIETVINRAYKRIEDLTAQAGNPKTSGEIRARAALDWKRELDKEMTSLRNAIKEGADHLLAKAGEAGADQARYVAAVKRFENFEQRAAAVAKQIDAKQARLTEITDDAGKARRGLAQEAKRLRADMNNLRRDMGMEQRVRLGAVSDTFDATELSQINARIEADELRIAAGDISMLSKEVSAVEVKKFVEQLEAALPEDFQRMAFLDTAMARVQRQLADTRQDIFEVGEELDELIELQKEADVWVDRWRKAYENAKFNAGPDVDERTLGYIAPKLQTVIFSDEDAKKIADYVKYYFQPGGLDTTSKAVNRIARVVNFYNRTSVSALTTADGSVRMSLLGPMLLNLARDPVLAAKVFAIVPADAVVRMFTLNTKNILGTFWQDPRTISAIRQGKVAFRTADDPTLEFVADRAVQRIPVVRTIFNAAQHDFSATWNYAVREMYFNELKSMERRGMVLDDAAKQAVGRSITRLAGAATNDPDKLETMSVFAARYFRSHIEMHVKAFTDGSLEGQLARKHLTTAYGAAATLVAATALYQNRDPMEVLSPFEGPVDDPKAWLDGRVRWNSNFLSIRTAGYDVKILGGYTGLMRIIALTSMLPMQATGALIDGKGTKGVLGAIGNWAVTMADSRGSPIVRFINDAIRGETYGDNNPIGLEAWAERVTPITWNNVIEDANAVAEGKLTLQQLVTGAMLSFLGASANPLTDYERRNLLMRNLEAFDDDALRRKYLLDPDGPLVYSNLTDWGRWYVDQELGKIPSRNDKTKERAKRLEDERTMRDAGLAELDRQLLNNQISVDEWKRTREAILARYDGAAAQIYFDFQDTYDPRDPIAKVFKWMEELTDATGKVDYDRLEARKATLTTEERKWVDEWFDKSGPKPSPVDRLLQSMYTVLDDTKFYETQDTMFKEWAAANGVTATDVYEWKKSLVDKVVEEQMAGQKFAGKDQENSYRLLYQEKAWQELNDNELVGAWQDHWYEGFLADFIMKHPDTAIMTHVLGNATIRKDEMEVLINSSPDEIEEKFKQMVLDAETKEAWGLASDWDQYAWENFEFTSDTGVVKMATYDETREAWYDEYSQKNFGKIYAELGEGSKQKVQDAWGKITDDNNWAPAQRRANVIGVLSAWDTAVSAGREEDFKRLYLDTVTRDWTLDEWDMLEQANNARGGSLDWLVSDRQKRKDKKSLYNAYKDMGMTQADLLSK